MSTATLPRPPIRPRPRTPRSRRAAATWAAGLIAVVGAANSFDQPHHPAEGSAEGRSVYIGQQTDLSGVRILEGWALGPDDHGTLEVKGLSVQNTSTSPSAPRIELVTIARGEVTARTVCSSNPVAPASVAGLSCTSSDRYQRRHDRIDVTQLR